jgi:8-oxo-dGTP pyrophosphatase MutT (NUDIX family)
MKTACVGYWVFRKVDDVVQTLIVGTETGNLSPPKGKRNRKESDVDCANRELFEETSLTPGNLKVSDKSVVIMSPRGNPAVLCYIAEIKDNDCKLKIQDVEELASIGWVEIDQLMKSEKLSDQKKVALKEACGLYEKCFI